MRLNQILKVAVCNIAMAILCLPLIPGKALAQTFSNTSPITISDNAPANPFPSNITINGLDPTQIYTISEITFHGVSHTSTSDIDAVLVAPDGYKTLLMSDNFGDLILNNVGLRFSDAANIPMGSLGDLSPQEIASFFGSTFDTSGFGQPRVNGGIGSFQPSNFGSGDVFSAPAPLGPYTNNSLSSFSATGSALNGQIFKLFIQDDAALDTGQISGGWQISLTPAILPEPGTLLLICFGLSALLIKYRSRHVILSIVNNDNFHKCKN